MSDDTASGSVTATEVGLPVLDGEGNQIGVLADVEGDEVDVDLDPNVSDDARASLGVPQGEDVTMRLPASDLDRIDGEDVLDTFPKADLDRDSDDERSGDVLHVDLGDVNQRG